MANLKIFFFRSVLTFDLSLSLKTRSNSTETSRFKALYSQKLTKSSKYPVLELENTVKREQKNLRKQNLNALVNLKKKKLEISFSLFKYQKDVRNQNSQSTLVLWLIAGTDPAEIATKMWDPYSLLSRLVPANIILQDSLFSPSFLEINGQYT